MAAPPDTAPAPTDSGLHERLARIRLLLLDVDGVMTDGGVVLGGREELKRYDARDGSGIKYLLRNGIEVGFVSGRRSRSVTRRARELGVTEVHQRVLKKWPVVREILERRGIQAQHAAYMGDDLIDLPVLIRVGLGIAPADAHEEVRRHVHCVTRAAGGYGAVREAAEAILRAQGRWQPLVDRYLTVDED